MRGLLLIRKGSERNRHAENSRRYPFDFWSMVMFDANEFCVWRNKLEVLQLWIEIKTCNVFDLNCVSNDNWLRDQAWSSRVFINSPRKWEQQRKLNAISRNKASAVCLGFVRLWGEEENQSGDSPFYHSHTQIWKVVAVSDYEIALDLHEKCEARNTNAYQTWTFIAAPPVMEIEHSKNRT